MKGLTKTTFLTLIAAISICLAWIPSKGYSQSPNPILNLSTSIQLHDGDGHTIGVGAIGSGGQNPCIVDLTYHNEGLGQPNSLRGTNQVATLPCLVPTQTTIWIQNSGSLVFNIQNISLDGQGANQFSVFCNDSIVRAGDSISIVLVFMPNQAGLVEALLNVSLLQCQTSLISIPISATSSDTTAPMVSCPGTLHTCEALTTLPLPEASDACGIASISSNRSSTDSLKIGPNQIIYTATDIYGNSSQCSFNVIRHTSPIPALETEPNGTICPGDIVQLMGAPIFQTYTWNNGSRSREWTQVVDASTEATLTVSDENGCSGTKTFPIVVSPTPKVSIMFRNGFLETDPGYANHQWFRNGEEINFANGSRIQPLLEGEYEVQANSVDGCPGRSQVFSFHPICLDNKTKCLSIRTGQTDGSIELFSPIQHPYQVEVKMQTILGQEIKSWRFDQLHEISQLEVSKLSPGSYVVIVHGFNPNMEWHAVLTYTRLQ